MDIVKTLAGGLYSHVDKIEKSDKVGKVDRVEKVVNMMDKKMINFTPCNDFF